MASRSRFYVDTPRDPSQRHSMFVTHSELAQRQDLSSNSSSATLPSAAGSVDRLTGLDEKKSARFFTLKPKTSFSLRPFFRSTSSLISLSPGKRRKTRRDSYVQTEEARPEFGEVGVQTLNASTVDVPVQTCLEAWEEGDSYGHRRLAYASARTSPYWSRPSVTSSTLSNSLTPPKAPKDPLASPKLVKYAAPGDSGKTALRHQSSVPPEDVNSCQSQLPQPESASHTSSAVPVKYFAAKELTGNALPLSRISAESKSRTVLPGDSNRNSSPQESSTISCESETSLPKEYTLVEYKVPEVSNSLKYPLTQNLEHPVSALKNESTDSPSRRHKSVHFDLSEFESSKQLKDSPLKPRNVDKDFEALLEDLNVLTDDGSDLQVSLKVVPRDQCPSPNLLSPTLKSALDALRDDFLAPIPENINESDEYSKEPKLIDFLNKSDKNISTDIKSDPIRVSFNTIELEKPLSLSVSNTKEPLTPSVSEYEYQFKIEKKENDSEKPTSLAVFTSANLVSNPETDSLEGDVYDNVIKEENLVKTVTLPTLPSFFEPPSHPESLDIAEIVENADLGEAEISSVSQSQTTMPLETEFDRNRLSRSSSRSSMRSNSKHGSDTFNESMKRFDSCENLDQLEEEIIRSLYNPDEEKIEDSIMKNIELPPSESFQNSGTTATHMRRVILDQLLCGKTVEDIVPNYPVYQRAYSVPDSGNKSKSPVKYTAVLTKIGHEGYESPSIKLEGNNLDSKLDNSNLTLDINSAKNENRTVLNVKHSNLSAIDSPKKTSVFMFPDDNTSNNATCEKSMVEISTNELHPKTPSVLEVRRSSWTPQTTAADRKNSNKEKSPEKQSGHCDFTNCLRPSKLQNSPFLAKINTRPMSPCGFSPIPPIQTSTYMTHSPTMKKKDAPAKPPQVAGECDYASCLKPSQVQNSLFTAELSEITSGKSTNSPHSGSPLTIRNSSPLTTRSSGLDLQKTSPNINIKRASKDDGIEPVKHKSEISITLQTSSTHSSEVDAKPETLSESVNFENVSPKESLVDENSNPLSTSKLELKSVNSPAIPPPPPPPPPPPSNGIKSIPSAKVTACDSMKSMIQDQKSNLAAVEVPVEARSPTPKTPVMVELELKLQSKSDSEVRNSNDKINDQPLTSKNDHDGEIGGKYEVNSNGSPIFISNGKQNGSSGILSDERERNSPLPSDRNGGHFHGTTKLTYSPNTLVTEEPPPQGAVLLDRKVTVDGDKVHTDNFYAIPVKEVLKEKTSTTKFIPAPPKYEGIGPTEDGIPIGLRNSVKKENMHNWYKTMFKSLHKADSPNDSQEYIIGYTSEPETSKKDMTLRKKSATMDNRSKHNINSNVTKPNYPSAKSSIEVYNVRPRLIEDYEPGYSSVTDDDRAVSRRYLPSKNTVKPSYEFKNGYESDSYITKKRDQPETLSTEQQKMWYREIQKGGDIPQFGLGKPTPDKPTEPSIGPVPPPPLNYNGPSTYQQAVRPLTLPADYSNQNGNGYCQQMNGVYEMQMRHAIHSEMQHRMSPSSNQLSPPNRTMMKSPSRSPDMRVPAQALFDFKAESPKEIPLKKGDIVLVLRQLDKNWYEGEHKGVVGIFPISYVEIIPPEHVSSPVKVKPEGLGRALYDFVAQTSIELTVRKGDTITLLRRVDANWFEGIFNSKKGIIPISYIQVLQEPVERSLGSPSQKSYIASPSSLSQNSEKVPKPNSISPSAYSSSSTSPLPGPLPINQERRKLTNKKGINLVEPVMYRALYSYSPQNSDELELHEGDNVYVVEMCDDGWFVGTSVRSGVFGIFPGNYVEKAF